MRMAGAREMSTVSAAHGMRAWYRPISGLVPAPGARQHLAGEPQPDRAAVLAGGLLGVMIGSFALIHHPPLRQCTGEGGQGIGADLTLTSVGVMSSPLQASARASSSLEVSCSESLCAESAISAQIAASIGFCALCGFCASGCSAGSAMPRVSLQLIARPS